MSNVPAPYEFIILSLAAFRVWKLLAEDKILDRPRNWLLVRTPERYEVWLLCPWCAGFHASLAVYLWWLWIPTWTLVVCTPFALSAVVGLTKHNLDSED